MCGEGNASPYARIGAHIPYIERLQHQMLAFRQSRHLLSLHFDARLGNVDAEVGYRGQSAEQNDPQFVALDDCQSRMA